jgi:hypothetical protein
MSVPINLNFDSSYPLDNVSDDFKDAFFTTDLVFGYTYLLQNKEHMLGIDGSDNRRAALYFRMLQRNYDYLSNFFELFGLKYYVRMTRFGKRQYDDPFDFADVFGYPEKIVKGMQMSMDWLFNYFVFKLK